jgi:hypothetical protein
MAKTPAERQKAYRASRATAGENGERKINTWISTGAALALKRLARRYVVTQRDMLERLILEEDKKVLDGLEAEGPEWDLYFSVTP